jgi:hypothetical protein
MVIKVDGTKGIREKTGTFYSNKNILFQPQ